MAISETARGFWESKGKNPALGAFLAATLIVALYGLAGNLVMGAYMLGGMDSLKSGDWGEMSRDIVNRFRGPILAATTVFEFLFFGLGTWLVFRAWHGAELRARFRIKAPSLLAIAAAAAGAAGLFPIALLAGEIFERAFPFLKEIESRGVNLLEASGTASWALLVISICLTPALCEEFLFRGYLQGTASLRLRSPLSWMIPGAYFALIHQNYFGLGALLVIGLYLAFVFEASGSIFPGMLVHFLYNGSILLLSNAPSPPAWLYGESGFVRLGVASAALPLAAVGIGGLVLIRRKSVAAPASR
jgi:uncharacterized protein